mgnify:FL=1
MLTRGIKHDVERFMNELSAKYLPFKYQNKTDAKVEDYMIQLAVRPVQLWEIAVPREHYDVVMRTMFRDAPMRKQYNWLKKYVMVFRKILGLKALPKYELKGDVLPCYIGAVDRIGLGIKEDYNFANGVEGI